MSDEKHHSTPLKNIIFTDGKILSFDNTEDLLKMRFCDYADSELEITFNGVRRIQISEEMYFDVSDYKLVDNAEDKALWLLDDENNTTFSVEFKDSSVKFL